MAGELGKEKPDLMLIHLLSSTVWGGRERYALDICRGISALGWSVCAFTRDAHAVDSPFRQAGIKVRHLPLGGYSDIPSILRLAHTLRHSDRHTVLHTHTMRDAFIALTARKLSLRRDVRVVYTCHRVAPGKNTALRRRILRNLHAIIFPSTLAADTFLSTWLPGDLPFPEDRAHILHNSVFLPDVPDMAFPVTGPVVASYYGRIVRGKGLETLINILPDLRGRRTRICIAGPGDPDYVDSLKRLAERLDVMDMIDWRGNTLSSEAVAERSHIGVFPSLEPEAFGLANATFMAYGRPIICTCNGAQSEYLSSGTEAILIPPADSAALGKALLSLVSDAELRGRMGRAAAARFNRQLSWSRFSDAYLGIIGKDMY